MRKQAAKLEPVQWATAARDLMAIVRLTRAWTHDADHFPPLMPLRRIAFTVLQGTKWDRLLDCPWCASFWVAGGALVYRRVFPRSWAILAAMLAASQVAGTLIELEDHHYA